jgi:hypothetical protein
MTELMLPAVSREPAQPRKKGFAFKAALCLGGVLAIVTFVVLWAEISKGSKVDLKSVIPEGVGPPTVPIAKPISTVSGNFF